MSGEPRERPLTPLDPARGDPNYWSRFHRRTSALAAPELARRVRRSGETVSGVVTTWSRAIVPLAAAAAATAALLILAEPAVDSEVPVAAEIGAMVESGSGEDPMSALLDSEDGVLAVSMGEEPF